MRILCAGLVLALLLAACGEKDPEAEKLINQIENSDKSLCFAKVTLVVNEMVAAVDAFATATDQATTAEQFAAGMQTLARATNEGWAKLQKLNDEMNKVGATQADADRLIAEPLTKALEVRDPAIEKGCEKWAETDVVQAALGALMAADEQK
jgi:hypothetical protein